MVKKEVKVEAEATTAEEVLKDVKQADDWAKEKSVSDVIGSTQFYPDIPKMALTDIQEVTHRLIDATVIKDFESEYGVHDLALLLVEDLLTGEQYTTACSGMVVVKKIKQLVNLKAMPLLATISKKGRYWDIT